MKFWIRCATVASCFWLSMCIIGNVSGAETPNVVLIYIDDLGYGDVSCYGARDVQTPNIDRIASEGCRFTDGHSSAATCTPSRYSLLTGEYAWRRKGTGIAPGDATAIIKPGTTTLASVLNSARYRSAVVGKWHLGLGDEEIDWNKPIAPGPLEIGFDECFLIPATGDRVPCVYVRNHDVVGLDPNDPITVSFKGPLDDEPTGLSHPELLKMGWAHGHNSSIVNGISRIGFMKGGKSARWVDEDMADTITREAVSFIDRHVATHNSQPFFLFFSTHDIHVPRVPHPRFAGKTAMGPRGDAIAQMDACVGEILKTLDQHDLNENTLVIFTSDNGPVLNDGYNDAAAEKIGDHKAAGPFRGGKYSAFEGGTRVPFLMRWPKHISAGSTSEALVSQIDLLASMASLTGEVLPENAAPDSLNTLPAFLGQSRHGRDHLVEQANTLAIRKGQWKLIEANKGAALNKQVNIETGNSPNVQLFDLQSDPAELHNVAATNKECVVELASLLNRIRENKPTK